MIWETQGKVNMGGTLVEKSNRAPEPSKCGALRGCTSRTLGKQPQGPPELPAQWVSSRAANPLS